MMRRNGKMRDQRLTTNPICSIRILIKRAPETRSDRSLGEIGKFQFPTQVSNTEVGLCQQRNLLRTKCSRTM